MYKYAYIIIIYNSPNLQITQLSINIRMDK